MELFKELVAKINEGHSKIIQVTPKSSPYHPVKSHRPDHQKYQNLAQNLNKNKFNQEKSKKLRPEKRVWSRQESAHKENRKYGPTTRSL